MFPDVIEAWANGPVVADLWKAEKWGQPPGDPHDLDEKQLTTLDVVIDRYGEYSGRDLLQMTHREAPWIEVSERSHPSNWSNQVISTKAMKAYFTHVEPMQKRLVETMADPETRRWLDKVRASVADGSARAASSSADDIRRTIEERRRLAQ